ncbi:MAG: YdcF family protein [Rhizobiales bacterium]|nr:YdcF family protein [Hyphomicrobiales bacterium]
MSDKLLALFAYPLSLALLGIILAWLLVLGKWKKPGLFIGLAATVWLWVASTPVFSRWALSTLESEYPAESITSYKPADVVIVLGGVLRPGDPYPDLGEAADRIVHAYRIHRAGLASKILISGGNVFPNGGVAEAEAIADLLAGFGIERSALLIESGSRNTFENARESAKILRQQGLKSALLVTSSFHMPRALAVFRRTGLTVNSAATDVRSGHELPRFPLFFLPNAGSLEDTSDAIKEWVGLVIYRWRGWA